MDWISPSSVTMISILSGLRYGPNLATRVVCLVSPNSNSLALFPYLRRFTFIFYIAHRTQPPADAQIPAIPPQIPSYRRPNLRRPQNWSRLLSCPHHLTHLRPPSPSQHHPIRFIHQPRRFRLRQRRKETRTQLGSIRPLSSSRQSRQWI